MLALLYNELAGAEQPPSHTNPHQSFSSLPNQLPDSYQEFVPVGATTSTNNGILVGTTSAQLESTHELTSNFSPSDFATDFSDLLSNSPDALQYPYQPLTPESVRMSPTGFMSDSELDKFLLEFESDNGDTGFDLDSFIDL